MLSNDDLFVDEPQTIVTECANCYTVGDCFDDGEAYICIDRDACKARAQQQVKAPLARCWACPLKDRPCVLPYKPQVAITLIAVGKAPGKHEVNQQRPNVGPAGQLMRAMFDHVSLDFDATYQTNAVLCRLENDADEPPQAAIVACQERLRAELANLPGVDIIAQGAPALDALDSLSGNASKQGILVRRGNSYAYGDRQYTAQLHPAFLLRSPGYTAQALADLRALAMDHKPIDWLHTPYKILNNANRQAFALWYERIKHDHNRIAFDVETPNVDSTDLICLGLTDGQETWIIVGENVRRLPKTLLELFRETKPIAHNGKFDQLVLKANGIDWFDLYDDTMLQHYALDENKGSHNLKQLLTTYLGVPDYEKQFIDQHFKAEKRESRDYSKVPREDLYQYLAIDCIGTLALQSILDPMIDADNVRLAHRILIDGSNTLQRVQHSGIKIDVDYLTVVDAKLTTEIDRIGVDVKQSANQLVSKYLATHKPLGFVNSQPPKWLKTVDQYRQVLEKCLNINLNSWQQVQVLLYDVLQLKHTKKLSFKTDPRSTNEEALNALEPHPFVDALKEHRRLAKIQGTYVKKLIELADENDRVHVNFLLHGTETGRLSATDGLHGIPRPSDIWGRAIRGSFIAADGCKLIIADYSQAELRCFAAESGEPFLLDAYNNDEDVHGNTCQALFPTDPIVNTAQYDHNIGEWYWSDMMLETLGITKQVAKDRWKELRTIAKNVNFGGLVYLGGASGIAGMLGGKVTEQQLKPILANLLAKMPIARQWQINQFRKMRDQGFVQSRFGNKRRVLLITEDNLDEIKKASVNAPIQNAASQLTLLSAIDLVRQGVKIVHLVHDSIIAEAPTDQAEVAAALIVSVMVATGARCFSEVAWKADYEISDRWYDARPSFD